MLPELPPHDVILGFGGNVGTDDEIRDRFIRARDVFRDFGHVRSASLYRTRAIGPAQPDFLNTAINVRIDEGSPDELIAIVLEIEQLLGRDRRGEDRWGPRKIDIDILLWGPRIVKTPAVELPHPRLAERRFALQPVIDLVGPYAFPGSTERIVQMLVRVAAQPIERVSESW